MSAVDEVVIGGLPRDQAESLAQAFQTRFAEQGRRLFGGQSIRLNGAMSGPVPIARPEPEYSERARAAGIQGTVMVKAVVLPDGSVAEPGVLRGLDPDLDTTRLTACGSGNSGLR
jgi:outer membrane biosynthesis protein TonB